jgi:hypothetical protein
MLVEREKRDKKKEEKNLPGPIGCMRPSLLLLQEIVEVLEVGWSSSSSPSLWWQPWWWWVLCVALACLFTGAAAAVVGTPPVAALSLAVVFVVLVILVVSFPCFLVLSRHSRWLFVAFPW